MTPDQVRLFRLDGFTVLPTGVLPDALARMRIDAQRFLDTSGPDDPAATCWRLPSGETYLLKIKSVIRRSPAAQKIAGEVQPQVERLLGTPARLMDDKITYKQRVPWEPPDRVLDEEIRKHTDAAYYHQRGFGDPIITVAVCLDDCTAESGAVRVWPGTHRRDVPHLQTQLQGPVVPDEAAPDDSAMILEAPAGSVLAWDARLVHSSRANRSGHLRRLLILGYAR
ncbi:hypothetical protein Acor_54850 [Acrocarpospora corrugata]|uniref:Phytanoyl-CoA dioxygenase n=1 Tax=Acrocarpospora corrugata TaxID=35763 RepID=A0A5M3W539_9ACTN|nr:phytanoyl-CoA dioxygenase family protein [Acrocarpospora corrugata]GES03419.1 hypothetical protein Acor_54850 [Acrocarpospora corrugata]